jgi:uncharacterized protein (DUF1684 family)
VTHRLLVIALAAAAACTSGPPPPVDDRPYEEQILEWRAQKDFFFRNDGDSPLLPQDRASFTGLPYYPIDRALRVPAFLTEERTTPPVIIALQTTGAGPDQMRKVGTLGFTVNGQPLTLAAFAPPDVRVITRLFVPFGDATSGTETYKGGRYLDLDRTPTGLYDLDFNRAYHPNCVYNIAWICPIPPRENRLPVPIRAGERLPPA